jgi:hypothetical protein
MGISFGKSSWRRYLHRREKIKRCHYRQQWQFEKMGKFLLKSHHSVKSQKGSFTHAMWVSDFAKQCDFNRRLTIFSKSPATATSIYCFHACDKVRLHKRCWSGVFAQRYDCNLKSPVKIVKSVYTGDKYLFKHRFINFKI